MEEEIEWKPFVSFHPSKYKTFFGEKCMRMKMNGSLLSLLSNSRHRRCCSKRVQKNFENKWPVCSSEMTSVCFNREQHNGCVCVCARWLCVVILRSTALKCLALKFGLVSRKEHKTTTYIGVFFPSPLQLLLLISIAKSGRWSNLCCSLKTPNALELNFLEEISIDAKTGFFALNFCWQLCHSRTIQRSEKFFSQW